MKFKFSERYLILMVFYNLNQANDQIALTEFSSIYHNLCVITDFMIRSEVGWPASAENVNKLTENIIYVRLFSHSVRNNISNSTNRIRYTIKSIECESSSA